MVRRERAELGATPGREEDHARSSRPLADDVGSVVMRRDLSDSPGAHVETGGLMPSFNFDDILRAAGGSRRRNMVRSGSVTESQRKHAEALTPSGGATAATT